jgi:hypothetical protein
MNPKDPQQELVRIIREATMSDVFLTGQMPLSETAYLLVWRRLGIGPQECFGDGPLLLFQLEKQNCQGFR